MSRDTFATYPLLTSLARMVAFFQILVALFKLRVVGLLLLAAVGGAFLGAGGVPPVGALVGLLSMGGMAAAGASALNQYLEREQDAHMRRTSGRPLVTGAIARPGGVLGVAMALVVIPVLVTLPLNPALAFFLALGAVIYVGVYTLWLKPRTWLNIVIGGAAGSCAVLSGGAAVGAWSEPGVLSLAVLIFLWTPTHFWSLALMCREDYVRAGIPMLPTRATPRQTAGWILAHAVGTGAVGLALGLHPALGPIYLLLAGLATVSLLLHGRRLWMRPVPAQARDMFIASNVYLAMILLAICVDAIA